MQKLVADPWRGLDFYKPAMDTTGDILIVGAGAIGSYTAFGLARMGVKHITVVDYDKVENHNLPNQFFAEGLELTDEIFKVVALERTLRYMISSPNITVVPLRVEAFVNTETYTNRTYNCIIVCVDDMNVRKWIWENMARRGLLLDARTGGLYANVYSIILLAAKAREYYKKSLYSNEEASPLPCSGQSIVDVSMGVAAELVGRYRTWAMNSMLPCMHTVHDYAIGQAFGMAYYPEITSSINSLVHEVGNA